MRIKTFKRSETLGAKLGDNLLSPVEERPKSVLEDPSPTVARRKEKIRAAVKILSTVADSSKMSPNRSFMNSEAHL